MKPKKSKAKLVKDKLCTRCGQVTSHTLFNKEEKIYKCNICGNTCK